jgi:hypothetical protein
VERNRSRLEARCLIRLDAPAEQACFPAVAQAARLTRYIDRAQPKEKSVETEWLIRSRPQDLLARIRLQSCLVTSMRNPRYGADGRPFSLLPLNLRRALNARRKPVPARDLLSITP